MRSVRSSLIAAPRGRRARRRPPARGARPRRPGRGSEVSIGWAAPRRRRCGSAGPRPGRVPSGSPSQWRSSTTQLPRLPARAWTARSRASGPSDQILTSLARDPQLEALTRAHVRSRAPSRARPRRRPGRPCRPRADGARRPRRAVRERQQGGAVGLGAHGDDLTVGAVHLPAALRQPLLPGGLHLLRCVEVAAAEHLLAGQRHEPFDAALALRALRPADADGEAAVGCVGERFGM